MSYPHVDWLSYRMIVGPTITFADPPPIHREMQEFILSLRDGIATFEFKRHYPTLEAAQGPVVSFLRAWEIDIGLRFQPGAIRFVYHECKISDRHQNPGKIQLVGSVGVGSSTVFGQGTVTLSQTRYPEPPVDFGVSPTVETLWLRFEGYKAGREPLPAMAYFCLTVLESGVGKKSRRRSASKRYRIDNDVLNKLGELTETRGGCLTARKMSASSAPYSPKEIRWIEEAVKAMIRQVAGIESGGNVRDVGMSNLPTL